MKREELTAIDRKHLWHPYTSMVDPLPVYAVKAAHGVYLDMEEGQTLIDGMSSWWSVVHGYNNHVLNKAAHAQIDKMSHIMFGGLTHQPAVDLCRKLLKLLPEGLDRIFYADSGSVSVEVAIKMALQYMQSTGQTRRTKIATARGGYHGDTWHAMSVCDPVGGMHTLFAGRLPIQFFAPRPSIPFGQDWDPSDFAPMEKLIRENSAEIAAIIIEPVVQGAGGMWFYHPQYLRELRRLCDEEGILLIADEIATGFYRTGKPFACEWAEITPDIMCLGKAITGGYMSFAATVTTEKVALGISENNPHVFMHGPTFMGNPLACAIASASMDLIMKKGLAERIARIEDILKLELLPAGSFKGVSDARVLGSIGVIETVVPVDMERFQRRCVQESIWVRPFGRLVYIMPPYIITDSELEFLCRKIILIIKEFI